MTTDSMRVEDDAKLFLGEAWSDPIEAGIRDRIRGFIEQLIEEELAVALGRGRYERRHWRGDGEVGSPDNLPAGETADGAPLDGHRHGHRDGSPARSGRSRSPCRGRGSVVRTGRDASGRARCCPDTPA